MAKNSKKEIIKRAAEIVPEVYEDGLKTTTLESGKMLALIPQTINAALAPLRQWIAQKEYNVEETKLLLAKKLERIDSESIVSPEAYIAVPALQSIAYCMDSDALRNMYANLLVSSMVKEVKDKAHPAFVEIIKQLSPDEAKLLKKISEMGESFPIIDVKLYAKEGYFDELKNFSLLAEGVCDNPTDFFMYLDNFQRLKLVDIPFGVRINNEDVYKPLETYPEIAQLMSAPLPDGYHREIDRKKFQITQFGKSFIEVCVKGIDMNQNG